jgi:hypothetical protein
MPQWVAIFTDMRLTQSGTVVSQLEDVATLPLASDRMERKIPQAQRTSVSSAANLGPVERRDVHAEAIKTFAAQVK